MYLASTETAASVELICLPPAGSGARFYEHWGRALAPQARVIAVEPPGRGARRNEPPHDSLLTLCDEIHASLPSSSGARILFGHSMGAIVAFELAHRLQRRGAPVLGIIVSGCRPPAAGQSDFRSDLPDDALLARLRQQGGVPEELLDHSEFAALFLPVLRADLRALEAYRKPRRPPLDCPIRAFAGESDAEATPDSVAAWSRETRAAFRLESFPGGHFFPLESEPAVFSALRSAIDSFGAGAFPDE